MSGTQGDATDSECWRQCYIVARKHAMGHTVRVWWELELISDQIQPRRTGSKKLKQTKCASQKHPLRCVTFYCYVECVGAGT